MEPTSIPKPCKIEVDVQKRKKEVQRPSRRPFEAILGYFGSHLVVKETTICVVEFIIFGETKRRV